MKDKSSLKATVWLAVTIVLVILSSFACALLLSCEKKERPLYDIYVRPFNIICSEDYNTDNFNAIKINSNYSDIKIVNTKLLKDKVKIVAFGEEDDTAQTLCENNCLQILCNENRQADYPSSPKTIVVIYVPMNFDIEADISTLCGDISLDNIKGCVNVHTGFGNIEIRNAVMTRNSFVSTEKGDISISRTNNIQIEVSVFGGGAEINKGDSSSQIILKAYTKYGNVEIND